MTNAKCQMSRLRSERIPECARPRGAASQEPSRFRKVQRVMIWRHCCARGWAHPLLSERFDHLKIRSYLRRKQLRLDLRIQHGVHEVIAHGRAVGELKLGCFQRRITCAEGDFYLWHHLSRGG